MYTDALAFARFRQGKCRANGSPLHHRDLDMVASTLTRAWPVGPHAVAATPARAAPLMAAPTAPRKNKKTNVTDTMPDYIKGNPKAREMHEAIHRPDLDHATTHHENGTEVERYEFHSELVYADPKRPHGVFV